MAYIDSRGAEMDDMPIYDALELVHELASSNVPDEHDTAREAALSSEAAWQLEALATVEAILASAGALDALDMPSQAQDWPDATVHPDRDMDPSVPTNAIRIALQMAENAAIDPNECGRDIELADECDRQRQAFDIVRDLLGAHGPALDGLRLPAP